jgi:hypothetical protein
MAIVVVLAACVLHTLAYHGAFGRLAQGTRGVISIATGVIVIICAAYLLAVSKSAEG